MEPKPSISRDPGSSSVRREEDIRYMALGVDLGTHMTLAAFVKGHEMMDARGETNQSRAVSNVVAFLPGGGVNDSGSIDPENTITDVKRLVGGKFDGVAKDLTDNAGYKKVESAEHDGDGLVVVNEGSGRKRKHASKTTSSLDLKKNKLETGLSVHQNTP